MISIKKDMLSFRGKMSDNLVLAANKLCPFGTIRPVNLNLTYFIEDLVGAIYVEIEGH